MCPIEAIRFQIHERLLAMDAANIELMKLVSLDLVGSEAWQEAVRDYRGMVALFESALRDQAGTLKPNAVLAGVENFEGLVHVR